MDTFALIICQSEKYIKTREILKKQNAVILLILLVNLTGSFSMAFAEETQTAKETTLEMYAEYKKSFPGIDEYMPETAVANFNDKSIVFVDVRKEKEMDVSMLHGAVTRETFLNNIEKYKDKTVVAYCTIGYRSGEFAEEMKKKGIKVYNLAAGILGWLHAGGTIYDAIGPVKRVHVYGKKWDCAPEGYETVTFGFFEKIMD